MIDMLETDEEEYNNTIAGNARVLIGPLYTTLHVSCSIDPSRHHTLLEMLCLAYLDFRMFGRTVRVGCLTFEISILPLITDMHMVSEKTDNPLPLSSSPLL